MLLQDHHQRPDGSWCPDVGPVTADDGPTCSCGSPRTIEGVDLADFPGHEMSRQTTRTMLLSERTCPGVRDAVAVVGVLNDPVWGHAGLLLRSRHSPKLLRMGPAPADAARLADLLCGPGTEQREWLWQQFLSIASARARAEVTAEAGRRARIAAERRHRRDR